MPVQINIRPTPANYFHLVLRRFGDSVALRAAILEGTGLSEADLADAQGGITIAQQIRQFDNMATLFGKNWFLRAPELWRPAAHGAVGLAAMSAPTVGAALETFVRYTPARTPNVRLRIIRAPGEVAVRHWMTVDLEERHRRFMVEVIFLVLATALGVLLSAADRRRVRYEFAWPPTEYADEFAEALCGEIRWNAAQSSMVLPKSLMTLRSPLDDPAAHRVALESLDQILRVQSEPDAISRGVATLLSQSRTGRVPAPAAARALGISQRTLVRRLAESKIGYRELVDVELKRRARRLLDAGVMSRGEIADRLGFADATGFSRACRRWFKPVE